MRCEAKSCRAGLAMKIRRWLRRDRRMHSWCARLLGWRADHLPAREGLKDEHCSAAVQANEARLGVVDLGIAVGGLRMDLGHCMKQLAHSRQIGLAAAVSEQSVMADAVELGGQDMQQEPSHELVGIERHRLVSRPAPGPVVLPAEGHAVLVHRDEPTVGDRDAVRIARQIGQDRFESGEGRLA